MPPSGKRRPPHILITSGALLGHSCLHPSPRLPMGLSICPCSPKLTPNPTTIKTFTGPRNPHLLPGDFLLRGSNNTQRTENSSSCTPFSSAYYTFSVLAPPKYLFPPPLTKMWELWPCLQSCIPWPGTMNIPSPGLPHPNS